MVVALRTEPHRATLLPSGLTLTANEPPPAARPTAGDYVFDPDPAIVRSGLPVNWRRNWDSHPSTTR